MKTLKKTTRLGNSGHYHIVYLNDETGVGATSFNNGHEHKIVYDPPRPPTEAQPAEPPEIDPNTGQPVIDPNTGQPSEGTPEIPADPGKEEGTWIVMPASDGHTHEIVDYVLQQKKSTETDQDIIRDVISLWENGRMLIEPSLKAGYEAKDFYKGKQWKENDKRVLEALNRATIVFNDIARSIDELVGYQIDQRTDLKFLPQEGGDQRVADILNIVSKRILDEGFFPREETKVFKDTSQVGRGIYGFYVDFNNDIRGDVRVERLPWDSVVYGPHEKEDLSDCEYECRDRMYSLPKLKQLFGSKADDIQQSFDEYSRIASIGKESKSSGTYTDYAKATPVIMTASGGLPLVDIARKEFRLIQCFRKVYKPVSVILNEQESFFFTAYGWDKKDIDYASSIPGVKVITQTKHHMRVTKICGGVVLSDEDPADLPVQDFFSIPVYAYKEGNDFWGKIEIAKDPQRLINKHKSLAVDVLNRLSAHVWFYDDDTFADGELEKFKEKSTQPGSMFKLNDSGKTPVREKGAEFPIALVNMMQAEQADLQRLMNITIPPGGANESGTLFLEKKKSKMTGNEFIFDNASYAKQKLGRILLSLIQRYYDAERIFNILKTSNSQQYLKIGEKPVSEYSQAEIKEMLENADLLRYDITVAESAFSPSTRLGISKVLFDLIQNGANIPPELPIEFLDIPQDIRQRILEQLQQQQAMTQQQSADTSNTEIQKTLIAKGQYTVTPEKAQELGLVPTGAPAPQENPLANDGNSVNNEANQEDQYAQRIVSGLAG